LSCIDRYNGFIYRRGSESSGGAGTGTGICEEGQGQVPEFVRRDRNMINDRKGIRKGRTEKGTRGKRNQIKEDKKIRVGT